MPRISRRDLLRSAALGFAGVGSAGWLRALAHAAGQQSIASKSVILLWLNGGPATIDLWDLKPNHENGGPFREIATTSPEIRISEHLPRVAKCGKDLALVRSLTSKEGDHTRATHLARTGYVAQAGIDFPAIGALVSHELAATGGRLPNFVSIAPPRRTIMAGSGFLGAHFSPFVVGEKAASARDLSVKELLRAQEGSSEKVAKRRALLTSLDDAFQSKFADSHLVEEFSAASMRARLLMRPETIEAFAIEEEEDSVRDDYGRGLFGQGCLLARRLVERGVTFVEVTLDGWDTHQNNFERVKGLSGELDNGLASLLQDLKSRELLDSTLVICQGEFGRTPKINANTGRDHWPRAWSAALAGGGIRGGAVVGKTLPDGTDVADRPCHVPDLIATVCQAIGIDPRKQNISNVNRPIRIADPDAQPIGELL